MIKMLAFLSSTVSTNSRLLISSTFLTVNNVLATIYNLQISLLVPNFESELQKDRKNILSTTSIPVLANKKIFSKNQALFCLSQSENTAKTIPQVYRYLLLIFYVPILVDRGMKPSLSVKPRVMALTSLPGLIRALVNQSWNWTKYRMQSILYNITKLAVSNVEVAETVLSFLTR